MTTVDTDLNPNGYTTLANTAKLYDVSTSTLRRYWKKGEFPKPIILFSKNYFKNSDLLEFNETINKEPASQRVFDTFQPIIITDYKPS